MLYQPYNCARDVYDLMLECWAKHTEDRPDFQVIHKIYQLLSKYLFSRKYLSFSCEKTWVLTHLMIEEALSDLISLSPFFQFTINNYNDKVKKKNPIQNIHDSADNPKQSLF